MYIFLYNVACTILVIESLAINKTYSKWTLQETYWYKVVGATHTDGQLVSWLAARSAHWAFARRATIQFEYFDVSSERLG